MRRTASTCSPSTPRSWQRRRGSSSRSPGPSATALINVRTATQVTIAPQYMNISGLNDGHILWNLPLATGFAVNHGVTWHGSILAPNADVTGNSHPQLYGQIMAATMSLTDWVVYGRNAFVGCVPPPARHVADDGVPVQHRQQQSRCADAQHRHQNAHRELDRHRRWQTSARSTSRRAATTSSSSTAAARRASSARRQGRRPSWFAGPLTCAAGRSRSTRPSRAARRPASSGRSASTAARRAASGG